MCRGLRSGNALDSAADLGGRDGHAVAGAEGVVSRHGLAVHTDQVVAGQTVGKLPGKEPVDGRAVIDVQVVREAGTVVVDEEDLHG